MSNRNKFARAPEVELRARFFSSNHNNFKSKLLFEFEVRVSDRGLPRLIADSTTKLSKKPIFFLVKSSLRAHWRSNYNNFKSKLRFEFEVRASDRGLPRLERCAMWKSEVLYSAAPM